MVEKPTSEHCLRLTGIAASFSSFVFAVYGFLLNQQSSFGKGFFAILIYCGLAASIVSIIAYMSESHRTALYYLSIVYLLGALLMLFILVTIFYLSR